MVAGTSTDRFGFKEAFVWTMETGMVELGVLGGQDSVATDINNRGEVVGWSDSDGKFPQVGFLWDGTKMVDLNKITDGADGKNWIQIASGLNDRGDIVGLLTKTKPVSEQHGLLLLAPGK
jgi:probable HAF family extracellular repeat protein